MPSKKFRSIRLKIIGAQVSLMLIAVLIISYVVGGRLYDTIYEEKKNEISTLMDTIMLDINENYHRILQFKLDTTLREREVIRTASQLAVSMFQTYQQNAKMGLFSENEAKQICLNWVNNYTYASGNHFFIFDSTLMGIAHPDKYRRGKRWTGYKDVKEQDALDSIRNNALHGRSGYSVISWNMTPSAPLQKFMAYYTYFEPWDWIIVTGGFIERAEKNIETRRTKLLQSLASSFHQIVEKHSGEILLFDARKNELITTSQEGYDSQTALLDESGKPLLDEYIRLSKQKSQPHTLTIAYGKEHSQKLETLSFLRYYKTLKWHVVYNLPTSIIRNTAVEVVGKVVLVILLIFFALILIMYFLLKRFIAPVLALTGYAKEAPLLEHQSSTVLDHKLKTMTEKNNDEAGQLAAAFAHMLKQLRHYISELQESSEIKANYANELEKSRDELEKLNQELESRVAERTAALTRANRSLEDEIKERKAKEVELTESEGRFRSLIEHAADAIFVHDMDGSILDANHRAVESLGLKHKDELLTRSIWEIDAGSADPEYRALYFKKLENRSDAPLDTRILRQDNSTFPAEIQIGAITLGGQELVLVIVRDVTSRKLAELELRQTNDKLQGIIDNSPALIHLKDREGKLLLANKPFFELTDTAQEQAMGKTLSELLPEELVTQLCLGEERVVGAGAPQTNELSFQLQGRMRVFMTTMFPLLDESDRVWALCSIATDISEKKHLQMEAIRTGQLATIGELAASVAHEINNPINGVINYAQLAMDYLPENPREKEILQKIIDLADRISSIVHSLLSYSRMGAKQTAPFAINDILNDSLTLTQLHFEKEKVTIHRNIPESLPLVQVRSREIQQVFINLLSNARQSLLAKQLEQGSFEKTLNINAETVTRDDVPMVKVQFKDNGVGISKELLPRIFDPFFTTKDEAEGTGLGLSICKKILDEHGGAISLSSEHGNFTEAEVLLPIRKTAS